MKKNINDVLYSINKHIIKIKIEKNRIIKLFLFKYNNSKEIICSSTFYYALNFILQYSIFFLVSLFCNFFVYKHIYLFKQKEKN